jgi:hypothetical protein
MNWAARASIQPPQIEARVCTVAPWRSSSLQ